MSSASARSNLDREMNLLTKRFKVGDRVSWNSEAGRVSGTIIRVHNALSLLLGSIRYSAFAGEECGPRI